MMKIDKTITPKSFEKSLYRLFELAAKKVRLIDQTWDPSRGAPVFTVNGKYTVRGWTEWTHGFQYGCPILVFDATGDKDALKIGWDGTFKHMERHVTHTGVHDHGFNNLSTFGNLRRLMREGKLPFSAFQNHYFELALKASGAVQAARWSGIRSDDGAQLGYIYSFNGPHSLFIDTMRSTRSLGVAWQRGHKLMHENDRSADLLKRSVLHGLATDRFLIFHGDSKHTYDVCGRTAHEGIFNHNDGCFRCRSTQQGYSPFSTWTRGLAWAMLGYAEELEFFATIAPLVFKKSVGLEKSEVIRVYERTAIATCDHYINDCAAADGIVYWDDGAPGLVHLKNWQDRAADPFNDHEPVDSSASAIAAQGLIRLGNYLGSKGKRYLQAGLSIARTLLGEPYLSTKANHQGLLLHSIYHRPNGWDHIPQGSRIPRGESSMWGDYHLLELGVLIQKMSEQKYLTFFDTPVPSPSGRASG